MRIAPTAALQTTWSDDYDSTTVRSVAVRATPQHTTNTEDGLYTYWSKDFLPDGTVYILSGV